MIERIIRKYVEKLEPTDIDKFARENGVTLTPQECQYLYHIMKTKWENVVFGDATTTLVEAKAHLSETTYEKVEELLYLYREKYKNYL